VKTKQTSGFTDSSLLQTKVSFAGRTNPPSVSARPGYGIILTEIILPNCLRFFPSCEKSFCFQVPAGMVLPKVQDLLGSGASGLIREK